MQSMPKRPPRATGTELVSSHRMKAQMLSPSMSTCTDAGGPISRPPGSLAHSPPGTLGPPPSANPLTGRYGLSVGPCAKHTASVTSSAAMPHAAIHPTRIALDMMRPPASRLSDISVSLRVAHTVSRVQEDLNRWRLDGDRPWEGAPIGLLPNHTSEGNFNPCVLAQAIASS